MDLTVTAVYKGGVLHPKTPLPIAEDAQVRLSVHLTSAAAPSASQQKISAALVKAGLAIPKPPGSGTSVKLLTRAERGKLAHKYAKCPPISRETQKNRRLKTSSVT